MNPVDKDNIKQIAEFTGGTYPRPLIEQIYLQKGKNMEATLDMFLTGQVEIPSEKIVVEVKKEPEQIVTTGPSDQLKREQLSSYVMQEYKDILFPK